MNTRPKNPANARNLNCCVIGSSGSGKTRFWLTPQLLQAHSSYVVVDPKGGILGQVGAFLTRQGYKIKVFNSIDFSRSMHYNPLAYVRTENDILKFVNAVIIPICFAKRFYCWEWESRQGFCSAFRYRWGRFGSLGS